MASPHHTTMIEGHSITACRRNSQSVVLTPNEASSSSAEPQLVRIHYDAHTHRPPEGLVGKKFQPTSVPNPSGGFLLRAQKRLSPEISAEHPVEVYVMESDITDMIADMVRQTAPELASRLEYQAEALRETECTDPMVGRWVDDNDVKYLLSAFALEDEDFAERFPALAHITGPERQQFIAAVEAHFDQCLHCARKRGFDLELDARIKKTCRQNSATLLQLLEEEMAVAEEAGLQGGKAEPGLSTDGDEVQAGPGAPLILDSPCKQI